MNLLNGILLCLSIMLGCCKAFKEKKLRAVLCVILFGIAVWILEGSAILFPVYVLEILEPALLIGMVWAYEKKMSSDLLAKSVFFYLLHFFLVLTGSFVQKLLTGTENPYAHVTFCILAVEVILFCVIGKDLREAEKKYDAEDLFAGLCLLSAALFMDNTILNAGIERPIPSLSILITALTYAVLVKYVVIKGKERENALILRNTALTEQSVKAFEKNLRKEEEKRHDLIHGLTVLKKMMESGEMSLAGDMIDLLTGKLDSTSFNLYSRNPAVNAVLVQMAERNPDTGIHVLSDIGENPPVSDTDLAAVVSCMMEILLSSAPKEIQLRFTRQGNMAVLQGKCDQSVKEMHLEQGTLYSIAERYSGIVNRNEEGTEISVILNGGAS